MSEQLMNIKEVAAYFDVSTRTIQNWLKETDPDKPQLTGFKAGNKWKFEAADLEALKQKLRQATKVRHTGGRGKRAKKVS